MPCLSQAISYGPQGVKYDKAILRKIVNPIVAIWWANGLGDAVASSPRNAANGGPIAFRGRSSDYVARLSARELIAIAVGSLAKEDLIEDLKALATSAYSGSAVIPTLAERDDRGRGFGPSPSRMALIAGLSPEIYAVAPGPEFIVAYQYGADGVVRSIMDSVARSHASQAPDRDAQDLLGDPELPEEARPFLMEMIKRAGLSVKTNEPDTTQSKGTDMTQTLPTIKPIDLSAINPAVLGLVDAQLTNLSLPKLAELAEITSLASESVAALNEANTKLGELTTEITQLRSVANAPRLDLSAIQATSSGEWPAYKVVMKSAIDVFSLPKQASGFGFDIPTIEWDGGAAPSCVPKVDVDYVLRPDPLMRCLYTVLTGQNGWAHGHTGSGKTTLIEQVAARMGWPVEVINLDSEITRLDIMGRDVLTTDEQGNTVTRFQEGIIPRAMQRPGFLILDECDFGRPDVMYAVQRLLTGTGITLTEDGGRFIAPHPLFRIWATGNTRGQGDETGLYQGARIQSGAFLNRFSVWLHVPYLERASLANLLAKRHPTVDQRTREKVVAYTIEHQTAFTQANVVTPFSIRDALSLTQSLGLYAGMGIAKGQELALNQTVFDRCPETDAQALRGIAQRIFG